MEGEKELFLLSVEEKRRGENKHLVRTLIAGSCFITLATSAAVVHLTIAILITMDYMLATK